LIIGIDLDNTLIDYRNSFWLTALETGILVEDDWEAVNKNGRSVPNKSGIKSYLLSCDNGDYKWEFLQGQVYGRYIHHAQIFPGAANFLLHCSRRGEKVFLISHKTEFGHYDKSKTSLRESALNFLDQIGLLSGDFGIKRDDIFFFDTRMEKVRKIAGLNCSHFIDDLPEVFSEPGFPPSTIKIHFDFQSKQTDNNSRNSWQKINELFFNDIETDDVLTYVENGLREKVELVKKIKGRGNSRVYKIEMKSGQKYAGKLYPDSTIDDRKRLEKEAKFCRFFHIHGIDSVPKVILSDHNLNFGLYEWISESEINEITNDHIIDATSFVKSLAVLSNNTRYEEFGLASAACLSGKMIEDQLGDRYRKLHGAGNSNPALKDFLDRQFTLAFEEILKKSKKYWPGDFEIKLSKENQVLSPSDFGFHNAFQTKDGLKFFDFEYFGWDDPVKLTCDFMLHPGMALTDGQQKLWFETMKDIFSGDPSFKHRLNVSYCLYGLCWCLIQLNVFVNNGQEERNHTAVEKNDLEQKKNKQLVKSKKLMTHLTEIYKHGLPYE
tara:strand:+ start:567 stop:2216 length:1650 start_codon:yes stop_codon:yes gene_type:complete